MSRLLRYFESRVADFYKIITLKLNLFKAIMWSIVKNKNPVWYFDATGSIHTKVNGQKAIFLYSAVCHDTVKKQIIPVFEFITTNHTGESIGKYISFAISKISQNIGSDKNFSIAPIIVTDFSFALINGAMNAINKCSLTYYIQYCYNLLVNGDNLINMTTHLYLCSTHFLKSMIKKVKRFKMKDNGWIINTFIYSFSLIQNSITMEEVENNMINFYNLFNSKYKNESVMYSKEALRTEIINRDLNRINVNNISTKVSYFLLIRLFTI